MLVFFLKYIFLVSVLSGIDIGHNKINSSQQGHPIEFEISLDVPSSDILYVNLTIVITQSRIHRTGTMSRQVIEGHQGYHFKGVGGCGG